MNLHANIQEIDVRVSTIPTVNGESISLRLLSRGEQQFNCEQLDLSEQQEKIIRHLLAQPNGIILLTGPTGCGKSTSLYASSAALIPSSAVSSQSKNQSNTEFQVFRRSM